eukprot:1184823-Prorocentrum_minimum.AAC.4
MRLADLCSTSDDSNSDLSEEEAVPEEAADPSKLGRERATMMNTSRNRRVGFGEGGLGGGSGEGETRRGRRRRPEPERPWETPEQAAARREERRQKRRAGRRPKPPVSETSASLLVPTSVALGSDTRHWLRGVRHRLPQPKAEGVGTPGPGRPGRRPGSPASPTPIKSGGGCWGPFGETASNVAWDQ